MVTWLWQMVVGQHTATFNERCSRNVQCESCVSFVLCTLKADQRMIKFDFFEALHL